MCAEQVTGVVEARLCREQPLVFELDVPQMAANAGEPPPSNSLARTFLGGRHGEFYPIIPIAGNGRIPG